MATENIVSKVYRVLTDVSSRVWDKISFWCLAKDVELANGKNLETTCGSITGITSSLTSTSTTMAASASAIKQLNDKIADLNSNLKKRIPKYNVEQRANSAVIYGELYLDVSNSNEITIEKVTTDINSTFYYARITDSSGNKIWNITSTTTTKQTIDVASYDEVILCVSGVTTTANTGAGIAVYGIEF